MIADGINAFFELGACVAILNHSRTLYRDKMVHGVSLISVAFFSAWGMWNIFYYPFLDQYLSFAGGILVLLSNCLWLGMMVYYQRKNR